jgi:hypothetical protein
MARAEEYAQWIVDNQDLQGTPEFETVAQAYAQSKSTSESGPTEQSALGTAGQMAAPAVAGLGYAAPTGLMQMGKDIVQASQPLVEAGKTALQGYARSPGKAIVDIGAAHLGLPPPYAAYEGFQGVKNVVKGVADTGKNLGEAFSKLPANAETLARPFVNSLNPADVSKLGAEIERVGLNQALKNFKAPAYLGEEALTGLNALKSSIPGPMAKLGQAVMPLVRGAARVAGPAGMAYNLYEAYPHLQQANIGNRVGSGEVNQLSQTAQRAPLNAATPAPLSSQEAANLLSSGDQRTIDIYGGSAKLNQISQQNRQPIAGLNTASKPNQTDLERMIREAAAKAALVNPTLQQRP